MGLLLAPDPRKVSAVVFGEDAVNVPQRWTVVPGPISFAPEPQFLAALKKS
jgi:hypothetical protein